MADVWKLDVLSGDRFQDGDQMRDDRFRKMTNTMKHKKGFTYEQNNRGGSQVEPQD